MTITRNNTGHPASFRDPSGFIFSLDGSLYRQVNQSYRADYDHLMASGLYQDLVGSNLLVSHEEAQIQPADPENAYKVIFPRRVRWISYPYEWCFSQLKDAALATLDIQKRALRSGMTLKDASAYNIQFLEGKPVLIDTLSFAVYQEGKPWDAYRQFCQHFLAPLALMAHVDVRLNQLFRVYLDGIPLDLASRLLPFRTRLNAGLLLHIHVHAGAQKKYAEPARPAGRSPRQMSKIGFQGLIDSLETAVRGLNWKPAGTEWSDYYENRLNYSDDALEHKKEIIQKFLDRIQPKTVWDLGANTGIFSRLASQRGIPTAAFDIDPAAVEINYRTMAKVGEPNLLPLVMDLTNPSPAMGWENRERDAFLERGPADAVLALALIHHLAISNNVPLAHLSRFFARAGRWLIIEFVPKSDSQVQKLLATRKDIFDEYDPDHFQSHFSKDFTVHEVVSIRGSQRFLYLMERRAEALD